MSERYSKLFALPQNLYTEGAPVVIAAGALLKDNQTGKVLAQLKLQSISEKSIKAAKVLITLFDTVGTLLDETVGKEFLDLCVARDGTFGQKTPVFLPNASTRSFAARVTEIAFTDNTVWQDNGSEWKPLTVQSKLIEKLKDAELVKQYQISFGSASKLIPAKERDLWLCTCGHINHIDEEACTACGVVLQNLRSVDFKAMQAAKQARLDEEAKQAQEAEAKAKAKHKTAAIAVAVATPILIALIVLGILFTKNMEKKNTYVEALSLAETGELEKSITLLESLGDYKDSTQQIKSLQYQLAKTFAKQGKYDQAIELYEALEDYEDSPAQLEETQKAKILKDIENYLTANYANKGGYDYDTYKCFEEYREHRYQNFTRAKAAIGMLDGDIPDSVKKLSSQISTAIGYYGKWKVVSGNTDLAYMDRVFPHNEVKYVDIALEYNKDGCFELYFLPNVIGATRVYKNGETFKISSNQKEPFEDKTDGKTITVIKNDRIVVRKYSDTKVIDKLILEKKS